MDSPIAVNRPRTFVEAVVEKHACGSPLTRPPRPGDIVWLRPVKLLTHDNTSAILARCRSMGATRVAFPEQCVVVLDHDVQNKTASNLDKYAAIEAFAREQKIEFHAAGTGIGHQVMIEQGHVRPGELCVAADSHANMYGALGALGVAVSRSDAAGIWASGMFWWEVPQSVRVVFEGRLPEGATAKDVALLLCALYPDDVLGAVVEFHGPGVTTLAQDDRLTLSNLTTEWGAIAGVFPGNGPVQAEAGASYAATITFDLAAVSPPRRGAGHPRARRAGRRARAREDRDPEGLPGVVREREAFGSRGGGDGAARTAYRPGRFALRRRGQRARASSRRGERSVERDHRGRRGPASVRLRSLHRLGRRAARTG